MLLYINNGAQSFLVSIRIINSSYYLNADDSTDMLIDLQVTQNPIISWKLSSIEMNKKKKHEKEHLLRNNNLSKQDTAM